jgi:hypothetical protein
LAPQRGSSTSAACKACAPWPRLSASGVAEQGVSDTGKAAAGRGGEARVPSGVEGEQVSLEVPIGAPRRVYSGCLPLAFGILAARRFRHSRIAPACSR